MKPLLLITLGYILSYAWLMLPAKLIKPFPFYRTLEVTAQFYYDYLLVRVMYVVFAYLLYEAFPTFQMRIVFFLFIGYVVDYILIYNDPYFYLSGGTLHKTRPEGFCIPVSYSLFMGLTLIVLCIISLFK